jgi:hypothetical protein
VFRTTRPHQPSRGVKPSMLRCLRRGGTQCGSEVYYARSGSVPARSRLWCTMTTRVPSRGLKADCARSSTSSSSITSRSISFRVDKSRSGTCRAARGQCRRRPDESAGRSTVQEDVPRSMWYLFERECYGMTCLRSSCTDATSRNKFRSESPGVSMLSYLTRGHGSHVCPNQNADSRK